MLDIKFVRENKELVKENIKKKFQDHKLPLVDEVVELDEQIRNLKLTGDELRKNRNTFSGEIGALMRDKKIDEANKRATKAEDILKIIKDTAEANFKKAYRLGYETAKREMNYLDDNNESSGGKEKEEETKLVLKPD